MIHLYTCIHVLNILCIHSISLLVTISMTLTQACLIQLHYYYSCRSKLVASDYAFLKMLFSASYTILFSGVFHTPPPARMGYCPDLTQLPSYETTDPDFLLSDIQFGKGKARNTREITMDVDGKEEKVLYKIVPCGGVKLCPRYGKECNYVVSTREIRKCPEHSTENLVRSAPCPVEFVYIRPVQENDCRRWITGIVRHNELTSQDLHNHPIHGELKITAKIDADIRRAIVDNPHLKTQDVVTGKHLFDVHR